jgi:serine protease
VVGRHDTSHGATAGETPVTDKTPPDEEFDMKSAIIIAAAAVVSAIQTTSPATPPLKAPTPEAAAAERDVVFIRTDGTMRPADVLAAARTLAAPELTEFLAASSVTRGAAGVPDADLDRILAKERAATGRVPIDPRFDAYITLPIGVTSDDLVALLTDQPGVVMAAVAPKPVEPPMIAMPGGTPNYQGQQYYENAANQGGMGAEIAWINGLTGAGVAMCDIEYDFNENHCDLPPITVLGFTPVSPYGDDHGTAVFGEMISLNDDQGTKGIAYGATDFFFSPTYNGSVYDIGAAVYRATAAMPAGSVIVLEVQIAGPNYVNNGTQDGLVPMEWWPAYYNSVTNAIANGMIVVQAAGNGSENLDDPIYATGNFGHHPFLPENDSGSIIVGAGAAWPSCWGYSARTRLYFSNYGSRVNLQGYGNCVATLDYGDLNNSASCDYTAQFSGTSSATPIVSGACMLVQEFARETLGRSLTCPEMREYLATTGTSQTGNTAEHIGPLPDVIGAINAIVPPPPPCDADFNGDGVVDGGDLGILFAWFGNGNVPGDLDDDGVVTDADVGLFLGAWGDCPE